MGAFNVKSSGLYHYAVLEESSDISEELANSRSSETPSNGMWYCSLEDCIVYRLL